MSNENLSIENVTVTVKGADELYPNRVFLEHVLTEVTRELLQATSKYGKFHSPHEGYGVILEELDELWEEIKSNNRKLAKEEATQVAAMGVRFILDI